MMTMLAVRCLNCNNVDEFPRMDYDEIPYCSQCAATSNLVPVTPPSKAQAQPQWGTDNDLASLFSRNLSLLDAPVTPPISPPVNFSVSQHYTHPTHFRPASPPQQNQIDAQLMSNQGSSSVTMTTAEQEKAYMQYVLSSNLGSENSSNDLEIALAHGIISESEYAEALSIHNQRVNTRRQEQMERESLAAQNQLFYEQQQYGMIAGGMALDENCSAHSMLSASATQRKDPVFRTAEFFNDYYGGVDSNWADEDEDEVAPCSVHAAGGRLRPFDL